MADGGSPFDIAGDAGDLLASIVAEIANAPTLAHAERLRQEAMEQFNIPVPEVREIHAQAQQSQAQTAQGSNEAKMRRMEALNGIMSRASEGYNAEDRAAVNNMMNDVQTAERGSREAIMRKIAPNSGAQLAAQLSNQQNAGRMAHSQGLDMAGQSRARQLQAMGMGAGLAGDIDQSEFGQSFQRGQAGDAMSQFNERNRMDAGKFNANQYQQQFQNKFQLGNAKYGATMDAAKAKEEEAKKRSQQARGYGRAGGKIIGTIAGS
jgi:hypothetical protein